MNFQMIKGGFTAFYHLKIHFTKARKIGYDYRRAIQHS